MRSVLKPAVNLMNKLKYIQKFTLIFIVFSLPIALMMASNIVQVSQEFEFIKKQRMGFEYNIALRELIQHVQQHRGLAAVYTGGKKELKVDIMSKQKDIEKDIEELNIIEGKYGEILGVTDEWDNIKKEWLSLKRKVDDLDIENSFKSHTRLINNMLQLNNHVSDKSRLVIQSRLETYYLVDDIVNKMPIVAEYMGQARAIGAGAAAKKSLSEEDRDKLLFLDEAIKVRIQAANTGMEVAFRNSEVRKSLMKASDDALKSAEAMVDLLNREILYKADITIDSQEYFNISTSSIDKIYDLLILESNVVDDISREDVSELVYKRNLILSFTAITILLIAYLFAGFYGSIHGGISAIENAASRIADGKLSERVYLEAEDETQKIQNALNKMADTLISNYKEVQQAKEALERVAHYDHLTGLPNRALFMEKLNEAIISANTTGKMASLMFIDLDKFKRINDTLGHQMGDVVLKTVAVQLTGIIGDKGTICRLGGDEFTILLPEIKGKEDVERLALKISEVIGRPWILNEEEHSIGASVGYTFYPCEAKNAQEMLRKADMEMYKVKQKKKEDLGYDIR